MNPDQFRSVQKCSWVEMAPDGFRFVHKSGLIWVDLEYFGPIWSNLD